jgi:hypothetical protein
MQRRSNVATKAVEPIHLIYREEGKSTWTLNPKASAMLEQIRGDLGIVAIIGQYRSGKSYILNRLAGQSQGFALGHTVKGCTRGIWCWGEPIKLGGMNVLLLDVEGLSDPMREDSDSSKDDDVLFTLSVLLSSLFIVNTTGTIDAKKFEALQVATNLSERIRVANTNEEPNSIQIAEQMPYLLWLVRDFSLELTADMRSDDDYLETCLKETPAKPGKKVPSGDLVKQCIKLYFPRRGCVTCPCPGTPEQMNKLEALPLEALNPEFRAKISLIKARITREIKPKKIGAQKGVLLPVDGPRFVALMQNYVEAINKGALPDVESAWQLLQKSHCQEAVNGAKQAFRMALEKGREGLVGNTNRALDVHELASVSTNAFKEAYDDYKKNSIGDQKCTATFLEQLGDELAIYKEKKDGTKVVKGGLLKEFTDKNTKLALSLGEKVVNDAIKTLSETQFPDFDAFKAAREKVATDLDAKLQKSVACPELSERFLKTLNNLSTKVGLQFDISAVEKEKERLLAETAEKEIENEKRNTELQHSLINKEQIEANVHNESDYLKQLSEKEYREMKERYAFEAKEREKQIAADLKGGFEKRAEALQRELQEKGATTVKMLMQMQKEVNARQAQLTQKLLEMKKDPPQPEPVEGRKSQGLLGSLFAPIINGVDSQVTNLVGDLVGGLLPLRSEHSE